ncbi:MAG: PaaI family thioesterase [Ruminococcaceae bacterium]|nr:PaaI family thioesterase [Oscillospiraceae bacterium]MBR3597589.1 PaaI family thioesterase [Clostridia bacterium]
MVTMRTNLPDYIKEAARTPYIAYNGIELISYSDGFCNGRIKIESHHKNLHGSVHGGCVYSLADTIASYAAMTEGTVVTTLNSAFNYLHPAVDTEYLYCEGKIIKSGKTVTVVRVELFDDNKKLLADGSFSCYNLRQR